MPLQPQDPTTSKGAADAAKGEPANGVHKADLLAVQTERDYYRHKAVQLDMAVFELRALLQSGKGFSEILNIEDLLQALMEVCREHYGIGCSTVPLRDDLDDREFLRVRAYHSLEDTFIAEDGETEELLMFKIPYNAGLLWQLIRRGEVFGVRDMQGRPRFETAWRKWNLSILKSDVWIPLLRGKEVLGIMTLGEREDDTRILESEYSFLQRIASVAATNIDSTLKYERVTRVLRNMEMLYDINQQLADVNDFKQLMIDTLATAVEAMGAQKANLMLFNDATNQLEIKVVWGNIPKATRDGINNGTIATKSFDMGEGVSGRAGRLRRPVRINDRAKIRQVGQHQVYCILAVPLIYGAQLIGVMNMTNKVRIEEVEGSEPKEVLDNLGRFTADDTQMARSLADQAAVNIHKARIYQTSITDRLTGMKNTRYYEESVQSLVREGENTERPFTLAITDIDHFKKFNDTHGHKAGDFVLAETARLLQEAVRAGSRDQAFRYGGEEFCMLLAETTAEESAGVLEGYRRKIEAEDFMYEGETLKVTVSIGICDYPARSDRERTIFEHADKALYASKEGGRNQVRIYEGEDKTTLVKKIGKSKTKSKKKA